MKRILFPCLMTSAILSLSSISFSKGGSVSVTITSPAFGSLSAIPKKYTCDGPDISPPIAWSGVPEKTKSMVLICDDPDAPAGDWVHWVCYDIPPQVGAMIEDIPKTDTLSCGGKQGKNDFGRIGWGGPCPPSGTHRYFFKVYCLDIALNLSAGKTKKEIEKAMKGHVIDKGELTGVYSRER
jgi:Raf kinase inhibitor-like YbhB/YbcL family protein